MDQVNNLQNELDSLRKKRKEEEEIKNLKKKIKQEKFNQSVMGKMFNSVGSLFDNQDQKPNNSNKKRDFNEILRDLPQ